MAHAKPSVLVVEDEALVRMAIVDRLAQEGFLVLEASNADDALAILAKNLDIRLVFTDVDMPGSMDGIKLAAAVRDRWPPIKIIVTSGYKHVRLETSPLKPNLSPSPTIPTGLSTLSAGSWQKAERSRGLGPQGDVQGWYGNRPLTTPWPRHASLMEDEGMRGGGELTPILLHCGAFTLGPVSSTGLLEQPDRQGVGFLTSP